MASSGSIFPEAQPPRLPKSFGFPTVGGGVYTLVQKIESDLDANTSLRGLAAVLGFCADGKAFVVLFVDECAEEFPFHGWVYTPPRFLGQQLFCNFLRLGLRCFGAE